MDGDLTRLNAFGLRALPGASFGEQPLPARLLDPGMGLAVARRTVFRPEDQECFGRVADRVAAGNIANADTPGYQARDFDFAAALRAPAPIDSISIRVSRLR